MGLSSRNTGEGCHFLLQLIRWCLLWGHILEYTLHLTAAIVQSLSRVWLFATLWIAAPPGFPVLHYLPEFAQFMSVESVIQSNHLILCRPLLLLPSIFPSISVFSNESSLHTRWPKHWCFSFSTSFLASSISTHLSDLQETRCHHGEWSLYWSRKIGSLISSSRGLGRAAFEKTDRQRGLTWASRLQPRSTLGHMTDLSGAVLDTNLWHKLTKNIFQGKYDHFQ